MKLQILLLLLSLFTLAHSQHTYYIEPRNSTVSSGQDFWLGAVDVNSGFTERPLITTVSGTNLTFYLAKSSLDGFVICSSQGCGLNSTNLGNNYTHGLITNGTWFNWTAPVVLVPTAFYYGAYFNQYWGNAIDVLPVSIPTSTLDILEGDDWLGNTWRDIAAAFIALFVAMVLVFACYCRSGFRFHRVPN